MLVGGGGVRQERPGSEVCHTLSWQFRPRLGQVGPLPLPEVGIVGSIGLSGPLFSG